MERLPFKHHQNKRNKSIFRKRVRNNKFEVRSPKHPRVSFEHINFPNRTRRFLPNTMQYPIPNIMEYPMPNTMQANCFWENYNYCMDWQTSNQIAWWKSRCQALEEENEILQNKIREIVSCQKTRRAYNASFDLFSNQGISVQKTGNNIQESETSDFHNYCDEESEEDESSGENNLEFVVDDNMKAFLETSIRHKMELKKEREKESELTLSSEINKESKNEMEEAGAAMVKSRNETAKLLYGTFGPKIVAMEAALEATLNRHKDKAKPIYWPNIPLNL